MANTIARKYSSINHISAHRLKSLKKGTFILVDVRSPKERLVSTIPGSIDKKRFEEIAASEIKNKQVIFYCTIGERSSRYASDFLEQNKEVKVSNLHGSILGWIQEGGPLEDPTKQETKKVHVYSEAWSFVPKSFEPVWN
jgi:rhodanese-related sulfurtransferase